MSFYNVDIIFTGLSFFCFAGADPACPKNDKTDYVYLVNAMNVQEVCNKKLPGEHEALLVFDRRFLQYADESLYDLYPLPDGGQLVVAPLARLKDGSTGFDICFREECVDPRGCRDFSPSPPTTADSWPGLSAEQDAPKWFKPDANHINWLPIVPEVEKRCSYELRDEVGALDWDFVLGRVRLDWGTLSSSAHARRPRKLLSKPYAVWESRKQTGHMPKAFAGAVTLSLGKLHGALLIQTACASQTPRTLFQLRGGPFRRLQLHVSNLPTHEVDAVGRTAQEHFRWYYRLFDEYAGYDSQGRPTTYGYCPDDVAIPQMMPRSSKFAWMLGVINPDVICPPAGKK